MTETQVGVAFIAQYPALPLALDLKQFTAVVPYPAQVDYIAIQPVPSFLTEHVESNA